MKRIFVPQLPWVRRPAPALVFTFLLSAVSAFGATLYVTAPTGTYDATRPVNIGDNRWRVQPQLAVGQRFLKALTVDLVLQLTNTSKEEVTISVGGTANVYTFELSGGAGVVTMRNPVSRYRHAVS